MPRRTLPLLTALWLSLPGLAAADCGLYEAIEPGDSLSAIAARCDTSVDALSAANPDLDVLNLQIGGVLRLVPEERAENARAIYNQLIGNWSEDGICMGKEVIVSLEAAHLSFGETRCELSDVQQTGGSLLVLATGCQAEGEPSPDQTVQITRRPGDTMEYAHYEVWHFARCTDL